jgi:hypothetical protein
VAHAIRFHGGLRHVHAQLAQCSHNLWGTPRRVGLRHRPDQLTELPGNRRAAGLAALAHSPPVLPELLLLPGHDGAGLHEGERALPSWPQAGEPGSE